MNGIFDGPASFSQATESLIGEPPLKIPHILSAGLSSGLQGGKKIKDTLDGILERSAL